MSALIDNIRRLASLIKGETKSGANTAARIGGLFEEISDELEMKYDKTETDRLVEELDRKKLDKVGEGKDVTVIFTESEERINIKSGEKLSELFGKVRKWFSSLQAVAFSGQASDLSQDANNRFVTDQEKANWSDKYTRSETDSKDTAASQATKEYATAKIAEVVNGSPEVLNTLFKLAAAINNDPNFAVTMMTLIGEKADLVHTHTDLSNGLVVSGLLQAYNYNTGVQDKAAITIDKPGSNSLGIGPNGNDMQIRYGAVNSINDPAWANNPITHIFDGPVYAETSKRVATVDQIPASMPANGGNADTVGGSHAWRLQSVTTDGGSYGANEYDVQSRFNTKGDGRFRLEIVGGTDAVNYTDKVSVGHSDYANSAGNAETIDGKHASEFQPAGSYADASHGHSADQISDSANKVMMTAAERSKLAGLELGMILFSSGLVCYVNNKVVINNATGEDIEIVREKAGLYRFRHSQINSSNFIIIITPIMTTQDIVTPTTYNYLLSPMAQGLVSLYYFKGTSLADGNFQYILLKI